MNFVTRIYQLVFDPSWIREAKPTHFASQPAGPGLLQRIKRHRQVNRAIRELSQLSNDTLRDIGIERGNIPELVEKTIDQPNLKTTDVQTPKGGSLPHDYQPTGSATA